MKKRKRNIQPGMVLQLTNEWLMIHVPEVTYKSLFVLKAQPCVYTSLREHNPDVDIEALLPDGTKLYGPVCSCCIEVLNE